MSGRAQAPTESAGTRQERLTRSSLRCLLLPRRRGLQQEGLLLRRPLEHRHYRTVGGIERVEGCEAEDEQHKPGRGRQGGCRRKSHEPGGEGRRGKHLFYEAQRAVQPVSTGGAGTLLDHDGHRRAGPCAGCPVRNNSEGRRNLPSAHEKTEST